MVCIVVRVGESRWSHCLSLGMQFLVYEIAGSEKQCALFMQKFFEKGEPQVRTQRKLRIIFIIGRQDTVPDSCSAVDGTYPGPSRTARTPKNVATVFLIVRRHSTVKYATTLVLFSRNVSEICVY